MDITRSLMHHRFYLFLVICCCTITNGVSQAIYTLSGQVLDTGNNEPIEDVIVRVEGVDQERTTDKSGKFSFRLAGNKTYTLRFTGITIDDGLRSVYLDRDTTLVFRFAGRIQNLEEVTVYSEIDQFGIRQLRSIEAGGLYEGKKTEVINIENLLANKATNNARQAFAKIPSLNIWESDFAGLQLDIGGRGLDPRRTSNFNTRQNGYDISADALGYPESYYTPPLQAIKQIELVRGAGALQYGSQFGGMINFKMRQGNTQKPFTLESENTYGAYRFFNTFNSVHGQYKNLNHYSYFQYKRGDGWRPNSDFEQYGAFTSLNWAASEKLNIGFDYTYMYYLSQQAGGLTDEQFAEDPQQSTRSRNWFRVNWNVPALSVTYDIAPDIKLYNRTFGLVARRTSLGLLTTPDQDDVETPEEPFTNRDLIDGEFRNFGNETRLVINYETKKNLSNSLLVGARYFRGSTNFSQFLGTNGTDADFVRVDTALVNRRKSDFDFPSVNLSLFAEKIIRLNESLSLIPGIRFEHIQTRSEGTLTTPVRTSSFGDVVEQDSLIANSKRRDIVLYGLGLSKKLNDRFEIYANATSNYRAINFSDIQIQTNTQLVDPGIQDENGYSFDIGLRKRDFTPYFIEAGLFYILYNDRIGQVIDDGLRVRTNIGSGTIFGGELYFEVNLLQAFRSNNERQKLNWFINGSVNRGVYRKINDRAAGAVRSGNTIENIPDYNIKTGLLYGRDKFKTSVQATFIGEQFSDAQNNRVQITPLAETTGVFGEIPAYVVVDFSSEYAFSEHFTLSSSINNLFDRAYFTRRATAYPGPGIIPAQGITWNLTLRVIL